MRRQHERGYEATGGAAAHRVKLGRLLKQRSPPEPERHDGLSESRSPAAHGGECQAATPAQRRMATKDG